MAREARGGARGDGQGEVSGGEEDDDCAEGAGDDIEPQWRPSGGGPVDSKQRSNGIPVEVHGRSCRGPVEAQLPLPVENQLSF